MKKFFILNLCLLVIFLNSCRANNYNGDNQDLYTVAIHSVLWNLGHSYGAERVIDSNIEIVEEDGYGRKLFIYSEKYYAGADISFSALIISQCSTNEYVYYYEDVNYIIKKQDLYAQTRQSFTEIEIESLKLKNDWGKELDTSKCIKQNITKNKAKIPCDENSLREKVSNHFDISDSNIFMNYLTSDTQDSFIIYGLINSDTEKEYFIAYVKLKDDAISDINFLIPTDVKMSL